MRLAGVYTRISSDDGRALGVQRQRRDCEALVRKLGWKVVEVYTDNDVSAFTSRQRPAYVRMLRDVDAGRLDALVCWDVDRLTRSPVELEDIIDLAEKRGVALASVGGDIDLATPQGRLTARIKASVARHEVEQSSRRIRRKALERAEAGRPHGRVAYGWSRVDGRDIVRDDQASVIREAATRVVAGESLRSITRDLNARAVPSPNGVAWHSPMLRQVLLRDRNVALRRHQGQVIGKAAWDPILDEGTFARLRAIFEDPRRRRAVTGAVKHLLSGIALCGKCNTPPSES